MCFTPVAATRRQASWLSSALRPSGFSQSTCLPFSAAAMLASVCTEFGPQLSNRPTASSVTSSRQSSE